VLTAIINNYGSHIVVFN